MRMVKEVLPHMRAQGSGRIINLSSVLGFIPAPYMAVYGASKHAIEGYSESLDHEVRQYGVRSLLVEPAYTNTGFEANSAQPDTPLQVYAEQRHVFDRVMAEAIKDGDDPAVVAKAIVAAATDAEAEAALHRRPHGRTRTHAAPLRSRLGLRQADPQDEPAGRLTPATRALRHPQTFAPPIPGETHVRDPALRRRHRRELARRRGTR